MEDSELTRKLEYAEAALQEIESVAKIGRFRWSIESGMHFISEELYRIHGLVPQVLQDYTRLVHPDDLLKFKEAFSACDGEGFVLEYRIIKPDQAVRYISLNAKINNSAVEAKRFVLGTMQDISNSKASEIELERKISELDRSNQDLEQFAYTVSHDLQEPLRKIDAFGDLIQLNYASILPEEGKDYIKRMQDASKRMQILIEDLLSFSKAVRNTGEFSETNLYEEITKSLEQLEVMIEEKKPQIRISVHHNVPAIPILIRQLFQNILSNSLKFSRVEEVPVIQVSSQILKGHEISVHNMNPLKHYCCISIQDNGIGFDMNYADKIFSPFQRLHTRNEYEGTGIGLAISKKIVERHNGYIQVQSELGVGSIFKIYLPTVIE